MADPLLSSLCRICNVNPAKYRCPRCSQQTCSLPCSKRHKLWSECSGIRDPTAFMPLRKLATPAGIDHDYNFISGIERAIERTNRVIVEEKGLVKRKELAQERMKRQFDRIDKMAGAFRRSRVRVHRAPKGVTRRTENSTSWDRNSECISWQVEWKREDGQRVLGKCLETESVGEAYAQVLESEAVAKMSQSEKAQYRKRKLQVIESGRESGKRRKKNHGIDSGGELFSITYSAAYQDPESSAWSKTFSYGTEEHDVVNTIDKAIEAAIEEELPDIDTFKVDADEYDDWKPSSNCYFYLLKPYTPADPRIVTPLHSSWPLQSILKDRIVQEYPTIFVRSEGPNDLPDDFVLECDFGSAPVVGDQDEDEDESDTSSEGESDSDLEEGEIM